MTPLSWGDPASDPVADVAEFARQMREHCGYKISPNALCLPLGRWRFMRNAIKRRQLTKRAYRRWRGRMKERGEW